MNAIEKYLYEKGRKDGLEEAARIAETYLENAGLRPKALVNAIRTLKAVKPR